MKPKYGVLLIWSIAFFLVYVELSSIADDGIQSVVDTWTNDKGILLSLSSLFTNILYAFGCYTVLLWLKGKPNVLLAVLMVLVFPLTAAVRFFIEEVFYLRWFGFDNYYDQMSSTTYLLDNLYYAIPFSAVGIVFYFSQYSRFRERQSQELLIQNQKTELAFLRSQINPHFLFNTLNNVYALVYQKSDKALEAMEKLTGLLRYALYENAERVPVAREVGYIEDFISLQRLRYGYQVQLQFEVSGNPDGLVIPPFSLIPFVENAFKHGELRDPKQPVVIRLERTAEALVFRTQNAPRPQHKDQVGGIGLANVRKRLSLIYEDRHEWTVQETPVIFEVTLKIPIALCSDA
jgi:sensor histidine kinase YesM